MADPPRPFAPDSSDPGSSRALVCHRLGETESVVAWAIGLVPPSRFLQIPPHGAHPHSEQGFATYFGTWSAGRLVFHLVHYESVYALPALQVAVGGPPPRVDLMDPEQASEEVAWLQAMGGEDLAVQLTEQFRAVAAAQLDLVASLPEERWREPLIDTFLGRVAPRLVAAKTVQHRLEHGNDLLKNALYWEPALRWLDSLP